MGLYENGKGDDMFLLLFEMAARHLPGDSLPRKHRHLRDRVQASLIARIKRASERSQSYLHLSSPRYVELTETVDDTECQIGLLPWTSHFLTWPDRLLIAGDHSFISDQLLDELEENDRLHNGGKEQATIAILRGKAGLSSNEPAAFNAPALAQHQSDAEQSTSGNTHQNPTCPPNTSPPQPVTSPSSSAMQPSGTHEEHDALFEAPQEEGGLRSEGGSFDSSGACLPMEQTLEQDQEHEQGGSREADEKVDGAEREKEVEEKKIVTEGVEKAEGNGVDKRNGGRVDAGEWVGAESGQEDGAGNGLENGKGEE